jgi:dynactin complex subunit
MTDELDVLRARLIEAERQATDTDRINRVLLAENRALHQRLDVKSESLERLEAEMRELRVCAREAKYGPSHEAKLLSASVLVEMLLAMRPTLKVVGS